MDRPAVSPAAHRMQASVEALQDRIIAAFEAVDGGRFERKTWTRPDGGGGKMAILRGAHLEKAGVNTSAVWGAKNPITGTPFFATGISLIVHPANPHAPTVHMNVRYFEEPGALGKWWYGGGMDLTPMGFPYEEDTAHFHRVCKEACDAHAPDLYESYRKGAAEYFYVKHRHRERGVGGIFFDNVNTGDVDHDFRLVTSVGDRFLDAYLPILKRRLDARHTPEQKDAQLAARGVYVEFNLLYDRGTRFGFESGGNPEAILASLPPLVKW